MSIQNNIKITFPDGGVRSFKKGVTGNFVAESISKSLSKKAIAILVNNEQKDLCDEININAKISILTIDTKEGLEIMRHTLTAQVLARAIKNLYPFSKLAIGPTIDEGFYYDISLEQPLSEDNLEEIEKEMLKIVNTGSTIKKFFKSKNEAKKLF